MVKVLSSFDRVCIVDCVQCVRIASAAVGRLVSRVCRIESSSDMQYLP